MAASAIDTLPEPEPRRVPKPRRPEEDLGQYVDALERALGVTAVDKELEASDEELNLLHQATSSGLDLADELAREPEASSKSIGDQAEAYAAAHHSVESGNYAAFGPAQGAAFKFMADHAPTLDPGQTDEDAARRLENLKLKMSEQPVTLPPEQRPENPHPPTPPPTPGPTA